MNRNSHKTNQIDFGDSLEPKEDFKIFHKIISDRRSVYSVSIGKVNSRDDVKSFLKQTKKQRNHHRATHHSWAVRISQDGVVYESKNDDGETGAGNVILRIMQKKNISNACICVVRWYGGIKLEADRFRHVQNASIYAIESL